MFRYADASRMGSPVVKRGAWIAVAGLGAALALHYAHALTGLFRAGPYDFVDTWVMDGLLVAAAVVAVTGALRARPPRTRRLVLAAGISSYAAGFVVYHLFLVGTGAIFGTASDYLWLGFYPLAALSLTMSLRAANWAWFDAVGNALALIGLGWAFVVYPAVDAALTSDAYVLGNALYAVGDLALLGLLAALVSANGFRVSAQRTLVGLGVLVLAAADIAYAWRSSAGADVTGSVLDPLWVTAMFLMAASVWAPDRVPEVPDEARDSAAASALPPLLTVPALVAVIAVGDLVAVAFVLLAVALVCIRLTVSLRSNRALHMAVRDAERQYRGLVESSQDLVWALDRKGRLVFVNPAAHEFFGRSPESVLGRPLQSLMSAETMARDRQAFLAVLGGESLSNYQTGILHSDGTERIVLVNATPRRDGLGQVIGTSGTATDITDRVESERQRARLQARAGESERLEALGRLAGGIAHDFNNLIAIIMNYAEFLKRKADPEMVDDLEEIRTAGRRAADLTQQLAVFSRHDHTERGEVDATAATRSIGALLARALGAGIELDISLSAEPAVVELGSGQLDQVLMNFAMNAREAMPAGGRFLLTVEAFGTAVGPRVRIVAEDTGCGMAPEVTARVFEPFYTTKAEGTGLGLATVHGIVAQAGGEISVSSEPGTGARFEVVLPGVPESLPEIETPLDERGGSGTTVLLVEDEPALRSLCERILSSAGYNVLPAAGGQEAISLAEAHSVDLVLTDVVMPGMSGPDAARRIADIQPAASLLLMSGYTGDVLALRDLQGAGVRLLRKPFTSQALLDAVHSVLQTAAPVGARPA